MSNYTLSKFTSPNAGVVVSTAGTDTSTTAALGQAIQNIDTSSFTTSSVDTLTNKTLSNDKYDTLKDTSGNTVVTVTAGGGLQVGAPTGGDKGAGTLNATGLYVNGTSVGIVTSNTFVNTLGADVVLNNTANFFDGPSVAQGTSGTWLATGTVTLTTASAGEIFVIKLWDGTTTIASTTVTTSVTTPISLSGRLATPAGNIRISVKDQSHTTGTIAFNASGLSKDSTITVVQIA